MKKKSHFNRIILILFIINYDSIPQFSAVSTVILLFRFYKLYKGPFYAFSILVAGFSSYEDLSRAKLISKVKYPYIKNYNQIRKSKNSFVFVLAIQFKRKNLKNIEI